MVDETHTAAATLLLSKNGTWWDGAMIISLLIAGLCAIAVGVLTGGSVIVHKREAKAADAALEAYKSTVEAKVAEATREGLAAGEKANSARAAAQTAQIEIEKQKAIAAQAQFETERLRADFANRRVTIDQHDRLVNALSKSKGTINFDVMGDTESGLYAADLLKVFTDAGWTIGEKTFPLGEIWTGLSLENNNDPLSIAVAGAFNQAAIPLLRSHRGRPPVTLMVGGKPPVF